jgi:hypothetical protein
MAEQSPFAADSADASFRSVALTPVAWNGAADAATAPGAEGRYSASPLARSMTKARPTSARARRCSQSGSAR